MHQENFQLNLSFDNFIVKPNDQKYSEGIDSVDFGLLHTLLKHRHLCYSTVIYLNVQVVLD